MWCSKLLELATSDIAANAILGVVWSVLCESFAAFKNLPFAKKRVIIFALSFSIPLLSLLVGGFVLKCEGLALTLDTFSKAVLVGSLTFSASQATHTAIRSIE